MNLAIAGAVIWLRMRPGMTFGSMKVLQRMWNTELLRKFMDSNEGKMQDVMSRKVLSDNMEEYGKNNPDTRLRMSTHGRNPDDSLKRYSLRKRICLFTGCGKRSRT